MKQQGILPQHIPAQGSFTARFLHRQRLWILIPLFFVLYLTRLSFKTASNSIPPFPLVLEPTFQNQSLDPAKYVDGPDGYYDAPLESNKAPTQSVDPPPKPQQIAVGSPAPIDLTSLNSWTEPFSVVNELPATPWNQDISLQQKGSNSIPMIVHQSWRSRHIDPAKKLLNKASLSWPMKNPGYKLLRWTDDECDIFVRNEFREIEPLYARLPSRILKADFFRYMVLLRYGGLYTDLDTECLRPISSWPTVQHNAGMVIGLEMDASDSWVNWRDHIHRQLQISQWTILSRPGHPILRDIVDSIAKKIHLMTDEELEKADVEELTGPAIWTDAVMRYLKPFDIDRKQLHLLQQPKLVDETLILPVTGYSPDNTGMGGLGVKNQQSLVRHLFYGSWRKGSKAFSNGPGDVKEQAALE